MWGEGKEGEYRTEGSGLDILRSERNVLKIRRKKNGIIVVLVFSFLSFRMY